MCVCVCARAHGCVVPQSKHQVKCLYLYVRVCVCMYARVRVCMCVLACVCAWWLGVHMPVRVHK